MAQKRKVTIEVIANNALDAEQVRLGMQSIMDELGEQYTPFIATMSEPGVARSYKQRIEGLVNNPMFKMLAKKF